MLNVTYQKPFNYYQRVYGLVPSALRPNFDYTETSYMLEPLGYTTLCKEKR